MVKNLLLIEDNKTIAKLVKMTLDGELSVEIDVAESYTEASKMIREKEYFLAIMGLVLPDDSEGKAIDMCIEHNVAVIVLTSTYDDDTRSRILAKNIFDYIIIKDREYIYDLIYSVKRAIRNARTQALVVDDSRVYRKLLSSMLQGQLFKVVEAENGREALQIITENPGISLLLTDYDMPIMNGFDLVQKVRKAHKLDKMAILVISGENQDKNIPLFLKHGANDYIKKPFDREEFVCRVNLNTDNLEMIDNIRNLAHLDILTGLYNKKYLFSIGDVLHSNAHRKNTSLALALVDIDDFQVHVSIHGEAAGHHIIKEIAQLFDGRLKRRSDVIARVAPHRFAVLTDNDDMDDLFHFFDNIRKNVAAKKIAYNGGEIDITLTIGLSSRLHSDFHTMYIETSFLLEEAKNKGLNQVWMD